MHNNMFSMGHDHAEVKRALLDHQRRDYRMLKVLDLIFGISLFVLAGRHLDRIDAIAVAAGSVACLSGIRFFIDQSNRNFFLHQLDWQEAAGDPASNLLPLRY